MSSFLSGFDGRAFLSQSVGVANVGNAAADADADANFRRRIVEVTFLSPSLSEKSSLASNMISSKLSLSEDLDQILRNFFLRN